MNITVIGVMNGYFTLRERGGILSGKLQVAG